LKCPCQSAGLNSRCEKVDGSEQTQVPLWCTLEYEKIRQKVCFVFVPFKSPLALCRIVPCTDSSSWAPRASYFSQRKARCSYYWNKLKPFRLVGIGKKCDGADALQNPSTFFCHSTGNFLQRKLIRMSSAFSQSSPIWAFPVCLE